MSRYIKISPNLRKEITRIGIARLQELGKTFGAIERGKDKDMAVKIAARELDFHMSARSHLTEEEAKEGILRSICQQFRSVEDSKKGYDIYEASSSQEQEADKERQAFSQLQKVTIAENSNEEDPLSLLAKTQPAVSQEFNDIMADLALQIGGAKK